MTKEEKIDDIINDISLVNKRLLEGDKYYVRSLQKSNDHLHYDVIVDNMWHLEAQQLTEVIQKWIDDRNEEYKQYDLEKKKKLLEELKELS